MLIQGLFFLYVFKHSCSTNNVLDILTHRVCNTSRILPTNMVMPPISVVYHRFDNSPIPHYCGFCGLCLGFTCINIGRNFVKHGYLISFSWPYIVISVYWYFYIMLSRCQLCCLPFNYGICISYMSCNQDLHANHLHWYRCCYHPLM